MSRRNLLWIAVVAGITVLFYRLSPMSAEPEKHFREFEPLFEAEALIRRHHVEPVDSEELVEGAIQGMLRRLDAYSGYIGPREMEAFRRKSHGEFIGIGLEVGMHRDQVTVIAPIEGGPAVSAGVRSGDLILAVDDVATEDLTVFDVSELLKGPAGSEVNLLIRHRGRVEPELVTVTRGPVNVEPVKGVRRLPGGRWDYLLDADEGIAYVRVSTFQDDTAPRFNAALETVLQLGARALVLDLRFNPGGVLRPAIDMVDRFVTEGVIVSTVSRGTTPGGQAGQTTEEYPAHAEETVIDLPLVVLINEATASAAEIVAGSLQAHVRARIVGTRSFGKGCVQHVTELRGGTSAIRLTVAYYQLPNGRIIHRSTSAAAASTWGVLPDVEVTLSDFEADAIQIRRREVDGFSEFEPSPPHRTHAATTGPSEPQSPGVWLDPQLVEAAQVAAELSHERLNPTPTQPAEPE